MAKLSNIKFKTGICIVRIFTENDRPIIRQSFAMIGRLENNTPFLLNYTDGLTSWSCADSLPLPLRRKILNTLRHQVRFTDNQPNYITYYDLQNITDFSESTKKSEEIYSHFFNDVWRNTYLDDRDEDYIDLIVPFAEKDKVKALGAKWNPVKKVCTVKNQPDMTPFHQWMNRSIV